MKKITVLNYGAGNVRSLVNAVRCLGYSCDYVKSAADIENANILVFPGVGNFATCMEFLQEKGYFEPLRQYILSNKKFLGICIGLQCLFESSEEANNVKGLGIIKQKVTKFPYAKQYPIPHIGWNGLHYHTKSPVLNHAESNNHMYFVHSYFVHPSKGIEDWILTTTDYGDVTFVSAVQRGNVYATQFHPEKSGREGLEFLLRFLEAPNISESYDSMYSKLLPVKKTKLTKRIIACLDVRSNDQNELVVTKGDQYDVRETSTSNVRNLGHPVVLSERYYKQGADEITFLNITGYRQLPLYDLPMLKIIRETSEKIFVPLTVGGGIRDYTDATGKAYTALNVVRAYFEAGADKISIGTEAVYATQEYLTNGSKANGSTLIEKISQVYGKQAIVISIDAIKIRNNMGDSEYKATIKGGREITELSPIDVATVCEILGAGEILLNCVNLDGQKNGFDSSLIKEVKESVGIPVIASSGAGCADHFVEVFRKTDCDAALAAGILHRNETTVEKLKLEIAKCPEIEIRVDM